jgi:hypothetical protein
VANALPSLLVGGGGSRGGNPSASRVRGYSLTRAQNPSPASLMLAHSLGTLSRKGRGEEEAAHVSLIDAPA